MKVFIISAPQILTDNAIQEVIDAGHQPIVITKNKTRKWHDQMSYRINLLLQSDALYIVSGTSSVEARIERFVADQYKKRIIYQSNTDEIFESINSAIQKVAGITIEDLTSKSRVLEVSFCRQIFSKIAHDQCISNAKIGKALNRDHSSVNYYLRKFEEDYAFNPQFKKIYSEINSKL